MPRETRVPTAMPALERTRLDCGAARWPGRPGRPRPARQAGPPARGSPGAAGRRAGARPGASRGRPVSRLRVPRPEVLRAAGTRSAGAPGASRAARPTEPGGPAGVNRGVRSGRAGGAGHSSASGSVVSAGLGPPPGIGPSSGGSGSASAACRPGRPRLAPARPNPARAGPRLRRRRPGVVHRPGHPVPPSGVARCWCLSRRYLVDRVLRGQPGRQRAATAGRRGTPR